MILKVIEIFINEYLHLDLTQNIYMKTNNNIDDMTKDYFIDFVISNTNILRQLIFCNKVIYNTVINFIKIYFNKNRLLFYSNSLYTLIVYYINYNISVIMKIYILGKYIINMSVYVIAVNILV